MELLCALSLMCNLINVNCQQSSTPTEFQGHEWNSRKDNVIEWSSIEFNIFEWNSTEFNLTRKK